MKQAGGMKKLFPSAPVVHSYKPPVGLNLAGCHNIHISRVFPFAALGYNAAHSFASGCVSDDNYEI
jgi:hypothetical protein